MLRAEHLRWQLETIAANATLALFIMDEQQRCTYMNPAAEALTGYTVAELKDKPLHEHVHHTRPDGTPYPLAECPIDQAFPKNMREQGEEVFVHRNGSFYPVAFTASPIRHGASTVGTIIEVRDISHEKREREEREFLLAASAALASSLDYRVTLDTVARLAVQGIADWCAIDELTPDRAIRRLTVAHPNPAMLELAYRLNDEYPPDPDAPRGVPHVIRTGTPELMAEIPDDLLVQTARDEEYLRIVRALGLKSYICVPLIARDQTLGALTLVAAESGRRYAERDLRLAEELAQRAAVAIDNARLLRETERARAQLEEQAVELEAQTEELQSQAMHLEEVQVELELSSDELRRANDELRVRSGEAEAARAAAEEANAAKSQFLATMSHELRTPLNAIGGYAELLEIGVHGPVSDVQKDALRRIQRSQQRLLGLINDVLNFARIEAGEVRYRIEDVSVREMLTEMQALIEPQARARGVAYEFGGAPGSLYARADRERTEQIVLNLLSNAVKFTPEGGEVELWAEEAGDSVAIRVRDSGVGVPRDRLDSIFEPFVQVDASLTRHAEGTGLGLAISRDLARAMGGALTAESEPGAGSTFTLRLARSAVP